MYVLRVESARAEPGEAVNEMFLRTHTEYAPWAVIEGNCKRHARIQALDTVIKAVAERLEI